VLLHPLRKEDADRGLLAGLEYSTQLWLSLLNVREGTARKKGGFAPAFFRAAPVQPVTSQGRTP
jgi:hypothetical protein